MPSAYVSFAADEFFGAYPGKQTIGENKSSQRRRTKNKEEEEEEKYLVEDVQDQLYGVQNILHHQKNDGLMQNAEGATWN